MHPDDRRDPSAAGAVRRLRHDRALWARFNAAAQEWWLARTGGAPRPDPAKNMASLWRSPTTPFKGQRSSVSCSASA